MAKVSAFGTTAVWDSITLTQVTEYDFSGVTADVIDVTDMNATAVIASDTLVSNAEWMATGVVQAGTVTVSYQYDPSSSTSIRKLVGDTGSLIITFSDAKTLTVSAILLSHTIGNSGIAGIYTAQAVFQLSGDIVYS